MTKEKEGYFVGIIDSIKPFCPVCWTDSKGAPMDLEDGDEVGGGTAYGNFICSGCDFKITITIDIASYDCVCD